MTTLKIKMINRKNNKVVSTNEIEFHDFNRALKCIKRLDEQLIKDCFYFKYEITTE